MVTRLVNVLDEEERTAFRAACVLPFFDVGLAAVVGQVSSGAVERAIRFALVEENRDSSYTHRVHDVIRNLVKIDRRSQGYWGDGDWNAAARRGLVEAKRRIAEARAAKNEQAEIEAIVLGIRLAHEWKLTGSGLEDAVRDGPSIRVLESYLPKVTAADASMTESGALISFVHAVSLPQRRGLEQLEILSRIGQPASARASLFLAYRQRSQGRSGDALATLAQIAARDPSMAEYAHFQYAVTLRMVRRFQDAVAYADKHLPESPRKSRFTVICQRMHGMFDADTPRSRASARVLQDSTRVRLESEVSDLLADARTDGVPF